MEGRGVEGREDKWRVAEGRSDNPPGIPICLLIVGVTGGPHLYVKLGLRCHPVVGNNLMIEDLVLWLKNVSIVFILYS